MSTFELRNRLFFAGPNRQGILTPADLGWFEEEGFLTVSDITTAEEIASIRHLYDPLFEQRMGWRTGDLFDFVGDDRPGMAAVLPQLLNPSRYEPLLRATLFWTNAHILARQILGRSAELVFEHAMMKPPRTGGATPWHQDEAFYPRYNDYASSITIWMPLQPVDLQNGCMEFIPGSHKLPLLPHHSINNDPRIPGLEADDFDRTLATACPLQAGCATIHHSRTLHYAGPNRTDSPRRAYALGFANRSRKHSLAEEHPWNLEKRTASAWRANEARGRMRRGTDRIKEAMRDALGSARNP